jgi:hypothetical protein
MLGAQYIVNAKKRSAQLIPQLGGPTPEFDVDNWLQKVKNSNTLIAEAEFADLNVDVKYKVDWIAWREPQLKQNGWMNMYDLKKWDLKKTEIDAKQGREQAEAQKREVNAAVAAQLQKKQAPTMLDNIFGFLGRKPPAEVQRLEQRQVQPVPRQVQPVPRPAQVSRQVLPVERSQYPQRSQDPQAIISSMYQEDNSSSYMFYIPIVGILIGISSMFLIK